MRRPDRHERRAAEHKAEKALARAQRNHLKALRWCATLGKPSDNICPSRWDLPRAYLRGEKLDSRMDRYKERRRLSRRSGRFGLFALTQALAVSTMGRRSR